MARRAASLAWPCAPQAKRMLSRHFATRSTQEPVSRRGLRGPAVSAGRCLRHRWPQSALRFHAAQERHRHPVLARAAAGPGHGCRPRRQQRARARGQRAAAALSRCPFAQRDMPAARSAPHSVLQRRDGVPAHTAKTAGGRPDVSVRAPQPMRASSCMNGMRRSRLPLAAKIALASAGAAPGTARSSAPTGVALEATGSTSTARGSSSRRAIG